jgi:hypothetical protein
MCKPILGIELTRSKPSGDGSDEKVPDDFPANARRIARREASALLIGQLSFSCPTTACLRVMYDASRTDTDVV